MSGVLPIVEVVGTAARSRDPGLSVVPTWCGGWRSPSLVLAAWLGIFGLFASSSRRRSKPTR